jgi:hypothetical protein
MANHDISPAMRFGDIKILLPSNFQIAFSTAPAVRMMRRKLATFGKEDFLLLTGDPAAIGLACAVVAYLNDGKYSVLKWDRREKLYIPIQIDVTEKGERND